MSFTGAQILYEPFKHDIVNVRASYFDEARDQVDALSNQRGLCKIGVVYQNDTFGKTVLEGVEHALTKHDSVPTGLKPSGRRHSGRPLCSSCGHTQRGARFWDGILFF